MSTRGSRKLNEGREHAPSSLPRPAFPGSVSGSRASACPAEVRPYPQPGHRRGGEPCRPFAHGTALRTRSPGDPQDVAIERAVMEQVGAGCFTPMGIYCRGGHLIAEVLSLDGKRTERIEKNIGTLDEARVQGNALRARAGDLIADAYHTLGISL